jgi:hypothetical protein
MNDSSRIAKAFVRPFATLVITALLVGSAAAQSKKPVGIKAPENFDAAKKTEAMTMINTGTVTSKEVLKNYYLSLFAEMSAPSKANNMHRNRANIKAQLQKAGNASTQQTHTESNALLLNALPNLIRSERYHAAFRYNCALLLADLDETEKQGFTGVAKPLPASLDKMIELLADKKLTNDSVRIAAIVGLTRHAKDGDPASRPKIAKAVVSYLDALEKDDTSGRKRDVKYWLEARAMECLGETLTPTPEVVAALQMRLADAERPIWDRCAASLALGKLTYDASAQVDANALFPHFKSLLDTALDQGVSRRELRYVIYSIKRGLSGSQEPEKDSLQLLMSDEIKGQANAMTTATIEMSKICDDKKITAVRFPIAIGEVVDKWRGGEISTATVDANAKASLEAGDSGSDETETPDAAAEDAPAEEEATQDDIFGE